MGDGGEQCADDWEYMRIEVQVSGDRMNKLNLSKCRTPSSAHSCAVLFR